MSGSNASSELLGGKIATLQTRIAKERKMLEGFHAMRQATSNADVIRTCEAKIRESQKTIGFFEDSMRDLEHRLALQQQGPGASSATQDPSQQHHSLGQRRSFDHSAGPFAENNGVASRALPAGYEDPRMRNLPAPPPGAAPPYHAHSAQQHPQQAAAYGYGPAGAAAVNDIDSGAAVVLGQQGKAQFTSLDLIKADTPLTSAKISRMLHQLEFKLHVERQYKEGIDKMAKLYLVDGDKKARADTENKRIESAQKLILLAQALKKYKTLDVMGELAEEDDGIPEDVRSNLRKPLSGQLEITIKSARDIAHAPQAKRSRHAPETVVYVKVEDQPRARTHGSRNDRWNENFEIQVDKANEVEVTIYDKVPGEGAPVPIGMLWLRLSDIVEELRRRKLGAEAGPGWVTAAKVNSHQGGAGSGGNMAALDLPMSGSLRGSIGSRSDAGGVASSEGIDAWFAVEPEGAVFLHLNFVKSNVRKRPYDAGGLGRQGAVRKRKEEIHEQNGHKFVQKQFYAVVMCALCGEFLLKGAGMQCEDCRYACHKNCYQKVVTKCISRTNAESDKDEDQINHRIPHRFESITNISPNWCCHCGLVLPLGRKNARKCSECGITAHADCVHLVPDFCGMSMEMANRLLADIRTINNSRKPQAARQKPAPVSTRPLPPAAQQEQDGYSGMRTPTAAYDSRPADVAAELGRLNVAGVPQQQQQYGRPPPPQSYDSYGQSQRLPGQPPRLPQPTQQQQQQQQPSMRYDQQQPQQPYPARSPSPTKQPSVASPARYSSSSTEPSRDSYGSVISAYADDKSSRTSQQSARPAQDYGAAPAKSEYAGRFEPAFVQQQQQQQQQAQMQQQQSPLYPQAQSRPPQPPTIPPVQHQQAQQPPRADPRVAQPQQQGPQFGGAPAQRYAQPPQQPQQQQQQQYQMPQQQQQVAPPVARRQPTRQRKVGLDDFNFLAVLGKGNFGKVMLAEEKQTGQLFAIKVLKKEFIIENDEVESTKSEKRVFLAAARERHPFLLGLHSCFQTETRIYFVMEYVSGGDLMLHIQREQFTPRRAKFYAAEVLLALEYFHQNGIIYRDLKLDNILLTLDGHVKVGDYGLCKEEMWFGKTTSTFCGTPEFMAPEIVLEQRYGRAVDWWAFGVLIYEMLLGQSPFRGDDEDEIFDAILEDEPLYPIHMPKDSVSILQKLLTRDPTKRLGAGESDAAEIKAHQFFKDTNWDDIFHKRIPPPFYPQISNATDTSNFDTEFTKESPSLTPVHSTLSPQDQKEFAGFSWVAPWANDV